MKTVFYEAVVNDCEAEALHLAGMALLCTDEDANIAAQELVKQNMQRGSCDYSISYTAGHYGDDLHIWDFSHYEIYEPQDPNLPSIVILRYRPRPEKLDN